MRITIFGTGYVGLVAGACFADVGNDVLCVDVDEAKIDLLKNGAIPIYEPGLEDLVRKNAAAGRLKFTVDASEGVAHAVYQFIAVGTPPDEDGSADLQYVLAVAQSIAEHMDDYRIIVNKSTVPVGTADKVADVVRLALDKRGVDIEFDVVSNPEFVKEGAAVADFMRPDRTVVGTDNPRTAELMRTLYGPFNRNHDRILVMDVRSSELTKYAANAMLATKISFMNELSNIADRLGADIEKVRLGIGSDERIGFHFIYAGCGYGGSCFPKDVRALQQTAAQIGYSARLLGAVESVNQAQKHVLTEKIAEYFGTDLSERTIAVWGLAFKPNTDDMREASSRVLLEDLWSAGARVRAYDPVAGSEAIRIYGERDDLHVVETPESAIDGADALVIVTDWKEFKSPDFELIREKLRVPVVFDGRNLFDPNMVKRQGIDYFCIGRPAARGKAATNPVA